jgi:hypothetical protein
VIAGLFGSEFADRRQYAESIASQHDDIGGLTIDDTRNLGIGNELDRVCTACIFGNTDIVVIRVTVKRCIDDVLKDRSESDGVENVRFFLGGEIDAFGIASSFDVEYAGVRPDVLVITDEEAAGVSG